MRGTACLLALCVSAATDVYVDPIHGRDSGDGSQAHPLQTIHKTQSTVRAIIAKAPSDVINVHLAADSTFFVTKPLNFTAADSGTITWAGAGKGATISGASSVSGWTKIDALPPAMDRDSTQINIRGLPGSMFFSGGASVTFNPILNLRSGTPNTKTTATLDTMLLPGAVVTSMSFSYRYCFGYSKTGIGSNFTLKLGSSIVYTSPHFTDYPYNKGSDPDKVYSPPVNVAADKLNITVPESGEFRVEFDFENVDRNVQLLLPMTVDITCAGACVAPRPEVALWRASVPSGSQSRHLYVNGQRANRTRSMSYPLFGIPLIRVTDAGYGVQDRSFCTKAAAWPYPRTVEFVYPGTAGGWTESRVTVLNVSIDSGNSSCFINMAQPAFFNFRHKGAQNLGSGQPMFIDNDGTTSLGVGDFYVDPRTNTVFLGAAPAPAAPAGVMMPIAEQLLHARGLKGVTFSGIHFTEATWRQPSGGDGYVEQQSGVIHVGANNTVVKTPANVHLEQW